MQHSTRLIIENEFRTSSVVVPVRFALISDLHNAVFDDILPKLETVDAVLVNGDLTDRHSKGCGFEHSVDFLRTVPKIRPVFYSLGNHERKMRERDAYFKAIAHTDVNLLDNSQAEFSGIYLGGLTSNAEGRADTGFLDRFEENNGYKLLLCHHPEVWARDVKDRNIDLTLCGHAHGGQINILGRGLFAPGQGLFPRYSGGMYGGGKMLLSRGMTNNTVFPRINNPCEFHIVTVKPDMV